ncbi:MAG: type IV pilus secretin PilQ, partial [Myxococcota bacterium]|nr:type IV pilus secretin PilQ [Myxococcota bacterium]
MSQDTSYEVSRVEDPPRLVIDLHNTQRKTKRKSYPVKSPYMNRVRLGDHPMFVRTVFELKNPEIIHQVESTTKGVLVSMRTLPVPQSVVELKDVQFELNDKAARIVLDVNPRTLPEIDTRSETSWVLTLDNVELESSLERSLDTSAYNSIVKMVSTYRESADSDTVKVVANLNGKATQTIKRANGQVVWEIRPQPLQVSTATTAPRTAGFSAEAAAVAKSTPKQTRTRKKLISLDLKDADILNVLRLISEISGENIIAGDEIEGAVTMKLRNVPWDQALELILKTRQYGIARDHDVMRIAPEETLATENEQALERQKSRILLEESVIKVITINYGLAEEIISQIEPLLTERGTAQPDERTNTIVVEDVTSNIDRLIKLAKRLDTQTPQVLIEARIVEAGSNHLRTLGIQWGGTGQMTATEGNATGLMFPGDVIVSGADSAAGAPLDGTYTPARYAVNLPAATGGMQGAGLGFIFGSAGGSQLLALRLSAMEENGYGRIVSSPRITTMDNKQAVISQGVNIPVSVVSAAGAQTQMFSATLTLDVTPHVTNDGSILMEINTTKDDPDFTQTGAGGDPTIKTKSAQTEVLVKDGDTTVIGGIYTRNISESMAGVPLLSRIPIIGWLFRKQDTRDTRSELLIFITPRIVNREEA